MASGQRRQLRASKPPFWAAMLCICGSAAADTPVGFTFDDGFRSSGCLNFGFSRPCATVGRDGVAVAPDQPRFGRSETIAGAPVFEVVRKSGGTVQVLGSGVDLDGKTPIMVTYEGSGAYLDVFTVAGAGMLAAEKTGIGRHRTVLDPAAPDLMQGSIPGRRYTPEAVVVCHGVVVVLAAVQKQDDYGYWKDSAVACFTSTNHGDSWELIYEDGAVQSGKTRGREWSMQNWWPVVHGAGPTEAYILAADYRGNPGATGGRAYMTRLTRPDAGSPWKIETPKMIHEELAVLGEHFHTAALVPMPGDGLRALIAVGDGQDINRVISLTRPDRNWSSPGWEVAQDYHGTMGKPGTMGNQFCGAAPGPRLGDVLVGSDLDDEQLMLLRADGNDGHPETSWVYGRGWVDGRRNANFVIRTPFPELGTGPYISKYDPHRANEDSLALPRRGLFSADGLHWAQVLAPNSAGNWTITLHGGDIYFTRVGVPDSGMLRTPIPPVVTARPLSTGPGGIQRLVPAPVITGPKGGIEALVRSPGGLWLDAGVPLDPQPPCAGAVYRCRASVNDASSRIGELMVAGAADLGDRLGTDAVQVRMWVRNLQSRKTARPNFLFGSSTNPSQLSQSLSLSATDSWMSVDITGDAVVWPGEQARLSVRSGGSAADDADFYLALEAVSEGPGFPGYARAPDATQPPVGEEFPDELASVSGFACGPNWTITLAGQVPQDGWDQSIKAVPEWPLCTLWGDAKNYISLVADTVGGRLIARVVRSGEVAGTLTSSSLFWLRGSEVLVSLADDGGGVRMTLSVAGLPVEEAAADQAASPTVPPQRVMFGDASGQSGDGVVIRVSPMEWFGGRIDEDTALNAAARRDLLTSLSFLALPAVRSADLDGDGMRTIFDFLAFQNLYLAGDPQADFDGNGVLDLFDYLAFQNAFLSPCG